MKSLDEVVRDSARKTWAMKPETKTAIGQMASLADLVNEARAADMPGVTVGRPDGGITISEYSHELGVSISAARRVMEGLVMKGIYTFQWAFAPISYGTRVTRQKFYRKVKR